MKSTSARERLESALGRIDDPKGEGARACLTVYREQAKAAADAADARCQGWHFARSARWSDRQHQGSFRRCRRSHARRLQGAGRGRQAGGGRCARGQAPSRGRSGHRGQDQHERICVYRHRRKSAFRNAGQSGGSKASSWRIFVRRGRSCRRWYVRDRDRYRHRRLMPHSRCAVRHRRLQAEPSAHSDGRCVPAVIQHRLRSVRSRALSRLAPVPMRSWPTKPMCRSNRCHLPDFELGVVQGYPLENLDETVRKRFL